MTFEEILEEHGVIIAPEGHHHARSGWVQFDCPFCSPGSGHYRMGYNSYGKYTNCWTCGPHRLYDTLREITHGSHGLKELIENLGGGHTERTLEKTGKLKIPGCVGKLLPIHKEYLRSRGFSVSHTRRLWDIRGIATDPEVRLYFRLFIPISFQGSIVSWTTRSITSTSVRYLSARPEEESISHKSLLYGEDYCRYGVIVHEGPTDVWATGPGAVATFGTVVTAAQIAKLVKYPIRVVCFDSEKVAQGRAEELCNTLSLYPGKTINVVLDCKDAAEAMVKKPKELKRLHKLLGR